MLPDRETLSTELASAVIRADVISGQLAIISRKPNQYQSTYPSEIVTCRRVDGQKIDLFCKYSEQCNHDAHGHRSGVQYELEVYRQLLQVLDISRPTLYGIYQESTNRRTGLILEYITDGAIVSESNDPDAMIKAARWIGEFHSLCEARVSGPELSFIKVYDSDYYSGWARRTMQINRQSKLAGRWLDAVCNRVDEVVEILCASNPTVIHGEFYPKNVLYRDGLVYPVDWESAAIGCGEIDMATLTDKWDQDTKQALEIEYENARWPEAPPRDFRNTLCASRIYMQLRWLGDRPEWAPYLQGRVDALKNEAQKLGLI